MSAEKTIDRARFPLICACVLAPPMVFAQTEVRPRIRDLGVHIGILQPGPLNAITDVAGVRVGQTTLIRGDNVRTGVTAILPHGGNLFKEKVRVRSLWATLLENRSEERRVGKECRYRW